MLKQHQALKHHLIRKRRKDGVMTFSKEKDGSKEYVYSGDTNVEQLDPKKPKNTGHMDLPTSDDDSNNNNQ